MDESLLFLALSMDETLPCFALSWVKLCPPAAKKDIRHSPEDREIGKSFVFALYVTNIHALRTTDQSPKAIGMRVLQLAP